MPGAEMNSLIRQLAEQAETKEIGYYFFDREKFAELIVKECIKLCDQVDLVGADDCIDNIKEHFEIK
jgi:hypothetical protein